MKTSALCRISMACCENKLHTNAQTYIRLVGHPPSLDDSKTNPCNPLARHEAVCGGQRQGAERGV